MKGVKRPEWLPEEWTMECRKRKIGNHIDKYYICPLTGKKFRSRVEVMQFLNINMPDHPAFKSATGAYNRMLAVREDEPIAWFPCGWKSEVYPPMIRESTENNQERSLVEAVRPAWLPEDWSMEIRKRRRSTCRHKADKYYICPSSGVKLRSRREVMRFLHTDMLYGRASKSVLSGGGYKQRHYIDSSRRRGIHSRLGSVHYNENRQVHQLASGQRRTHTPENFSLVEEFLPLAVLKRSKLKRVAVRRRLFSVEKQTSNASMAIVVAHPPQKLDSSSFSYTSPQYGDCSQTSYPIPLYFEFQDQGIRKFQVASQSSTTYTEDKQFELLKIQREPLQVPPHGERRLQRGIKMLPDTKTLMRVGCKILGTPHTNMLEKLSKMMKNIRLPLQVLFNGEHEKLLKKLMQVESKKIPAPAANLSIEEQQPDIKEKQHQLLLMPSDEKLEGKSVIEKLLEPVNDDLSKTLMEMDGNSLPPSDVTCSGVEESEPTKDQSRVLQITLHADELEGKKTEMLTDLGNYNLSKTLMEVETRFFPHVISSEERQSDLKRKKCNPLLTLCHAEEHKGQQETQVLQDVRKVKLSKTSVKLQDNSSTAQGVHLPEKKRQPRATMKTNSQKRRGTGRPRGSSNNSKECTTASVIEQPSPLRKRKAAKTTDSSKQASKRAASVTSDVVVPLAATWSSYRNEDVMFIADELQRKLKIGESLVRQKVVPQTTVPSVGSCWRNPCKLAGFAAYAVPGFNIGPQPIISSQNPCKLAGFKAYADPKFRMKPLMSSTSLTQPNEPVEKTASCFSHQMEKDMPITNEFELKLKIKETPVEEKVDPDKTAPFGDSWPDPCIEFAFKTLTSDSIVVEDIVAMQDYFNGQFSSFERTNLSAGGCKLVVDGPPNCVSDGVKDLCQKKCGGRKNRREGGSLPKAMRGKKVSKKGLNPVKENA